jgi:hypothetical protein
MPEYTPANTGAVALRDPAQQPNIGPVSSTTLGCSAIVKAWLPESRQIDTAAQTPCSYQLRLYYFPFWRVLSDGKALTASFGTTGMLTFSVPAGEHRIDVRFERPRKPRLAGDAITGLALLILAGLALLSRYERALVPIPATTYV